MKTINKSEESNFTRRRFLGVAAMSVAAAKFMLGSASAQTTQADAANGNMNKPGTNTSFGPLKQINTGVLNVGYAEAGPANGPVVILLHGWPYDIYSFVDVAPILASAGYRVIVPYLRGYGTTSFLSSETFRNGQPSAVALDTIALMDALKIQKAIIGGFDWGAGIANIIAALWPERCKALVSVSGYLIGSPAAFKLPLPPNAEHAWWYLYYFATERGRAGYEEYRRDFAKLIWRLASPKWDFDEATFNRTAASFDNSAHASIVIHHYRWLLGLAEGEPKKTTWKGGLPKGRSSPCPPLPLKAMPMAHHIQTSAPMPRNTRANLKGGVGHNLPQEAPQAFAKAIIDVDSF
jgi:pimeloyl-ACP methyl ester carboxylesterase